MRFFPSELPQCRAICAAVFFLVSACASTPDATSPELTEAPLCARDGIEIRTDFAGAGQHGCAIRDDEFVLTVWPEPSLHGRINPSPWYAFSLAGAGDEPVRVVLDYGSYNHRYPPLLRQGGEGEWAPLPESSLNVLEDGHKAVLTLPGSDDLTVAGLPIETSADALEWTENTASVFGLDVVSYGQSAEGRPLMAIAAGSEDASKLVVALTRQHPPELAGALAFQAFVIDVLSTYPKAVLEDTRFVFFPMMNPDGVDNGYWRHNTGAVDLNRDWFDATQPEVASAQALILAEAEGREVAAFLDFHSTWRTLVYFHPFDTPGADSSFPEALKQAMDSEISPTPDWISSHNDGKGTSKNWALQMFATPGMTIELGDSVSADDAAEVGRLTARVLSQKIGDRLD